MVRRLLRPRVVIPLTLSIGVLGALLTLGNFDRIVAEVTAFQAQDMLWCIILFLVYELLRGAQWTVLLRTLDARVPSRSVAVSFLSGEVTKYLPLGNYFPNYVLRETDRLDFGSTSAATLGIVLFEVVVSLAGVAILGLGAWSGWLRPLVVGGSLAVVLLGAVIVHFRARLVTPSWLTRRRWMRSALVELQRCGVGLRLLAHPRTLLLGTVLCAAYIATASAALLAVLHGLGDFSLSYAQVAGVYSFTLAFALIEPSPMDLGILELGGVAALLVVGADPTTAVAAMLISRLFSVAVSLSVAAIGLALLHRTVGRALRGKAASEAERPESFDATPPPRSR
jgi:uncharacterized membrane protein YbhN (UPF0104 family)